MAEQAPNRRSFLRVAALAGLIAVPLILLIVNILLMREFEAGEARRDALDRSFETRALLLEVLSLNQDIETGQRGFVITANPEFLGPASHSRIVFLSATIAPKSGTIGAPRARRSAS